MIDTFDDFGVYVYVIVDDLWDQIAPRLSKPGPAPEGSDSELITRLLLGECRGWDVETDLMSCWREDPDLFPIIPSQDRFNRRRRNLTPAINRLRHALLALLDLAEDRPWAIDSLPIPVVPFHLVPGSTGDWRAHGAAFGKGSSKKVTIFGYKLHLWVTLSGLILDFELAPANATDLEVGTALLEQHTGLEVFGDKGYLSAEVAAHLRLLTLPRVNQKVQVPPAVSRTFNAARQLVEPVHGQLTEQFHIEPNHAHTFQGLGARLIT